MNNKKALIISKFDEEKMLSALVKLAIDNDLEFKIIKITDEEVYRDNIKSDYLIKSDTYFNERIAGKILDIIEDLKPDFIFATSSYEIKNIIGKIAVEKSTGVLTDCFSIEIKDGDFFAYKYIYGDSVALKLTSTSKIKIITFNKIDMDDKALDLKINDVKKIIIPDEKEIRLIKKEKKAIKKDIENSSKVVGIGRGVKKEDIPLIEKFALSIDAAIGYTRPLIYEGIGEYHQQIGITGKIISPQLYIAIGISGKEYHIKGVEKAKKIISINIDPNAPIKSFSDYFICSDYKNVIVKLIESK